MNVRPFCRIAAALSCMAVLGTPALAIDHTRSRPGSDLRAGIAQDAPSPERGQAERGRLFVTVDRAKIIRLPEATKTVIIGNPAIADVAIQKAGVVVMTGKSYGETNLIALDGTGNMLAESTLSVQAPSEAIVVVQRGLERQSYSCTPACQPSVILGDANSYFNSTKEQAVQHGQFSGGR